MFTMTKRFGNSSRGAAHGASLRRTHAIRCARGFTLIELSATMGIAAILATLAQPQLSTYLKNDRQTVEMNSLLAALTTARSEAARQNVPVEVSAYTNAASRAGTASWSNGWIVASTAANAAPLSVGAPLPSGSSLSARTTTQTNGVTEVTEVAGLTFLSTGTLAPYKAIGFTLCDARGGTRARYLEIAISGGVSVSQNVGYDVTGDALKCP